jgi:DNA ligase 4
MPFQYSLLCRLLNELDQNRERRISRLNVTNSETQIVRTWFDQHSSLIPRKGREAVAFLSCLFPHRRPDRVFGLQERRLESIIGRALCLGRTRLKDLQQWRTRDGVDFASSVGRVMSATDSALQPDSGVTVDWVDEVLDQIAARSSFSSPKLRTDVQAR